MGTLTFGVMAFFRSETNKISLYKKYEKEVLMYMKWKSDLEIQRYLKKEIALWCFH